MLRHIPEGAKLFDIGCGSGSLLYLATRLRRAKLAHGYDISEAATAAAVSLSTDENIRVHHHPAEKGIPDLSEYDTVTAIDVLHHVPQPHQESFLVEIYEKIAPGARLIILDIRRETRVRAFCNRLHDLLISRELVNPMETRSVMSALWKLGARLHDHEVHNTLWYGHYLLVVEKPMPTTTQIVIPIQKIFGEMKTAKEAVLSR